MTARACLNRLHRSTVTISTRAVAAHQPRIAGESTATNVFQKILLTFVEIGREYARFIERSRLPLPSTIVTNLGRLFRHRLRAASALFVRCGSLGGVAADFEMKLTCCMFLGSCLLGDMANVVRLRR